MPPVMVAARSYGEYVGIPTRHRQARLHPGGHQLLALFYIVHLEALKLGLAATRVSATHDGQSCDVLAPRPGRQCRRARIIYYVALAPSGVRSGSSGDSQRAARCALRLQRVVRREQPDLPTEIDVTKPDPSANLATVKAACTS